jgi:D-alanyl-D-alanine dipeptidase
MRITKLYDLLSASTLNRVPDFKSMFFFYLLVFLLFDAQKMQAQDCPAREVLKKSGLLEIQKEIPGILVDLRYSGTNNFTRKDLYGCLSQAFGRPELISKLKVANQMLQARKPGYHFLVFDAARPLQSQWALWNAIKLPESKKHVYVADPKKGSIHNYGCALDISITNESGTPLDMGTEFDFFGELAQPRCEQKLLLNGKLTKVQVANRELLRFCMKKAGFSGTSSEWWHFNACSLRQAKQRYSIIP